MEKRKWLWKRRSSERSPGETESSGSVSSHSERYSDEQEGFKASPSNNTQSPEVSSKASADPEDINDSVKCLTEKLSAALVNVSAKEDLVKQHAKVAEEAIAGWEKAENEVVVLKQKLEAANQQNSALEDRVRHLDGALKECVRQLRQGREEQEQKIREAVAKATSEWETTKFELETQILELQNKAEAIKCETPNQSITDLCHKIEALEKENSALRLELLSQMEELEIRTIERDLSTQAAETASKQHLESIKKVAKLEAECRKLKSVASKTYSVNDHKSTAASSIYVESLTDSQSDSAERVNVMELDTRKISTMEANKSELSCSDSWASALIAELDQFKNEKAANRNITSSSVDIDLMDDFLEMERLAALHETKSKDNYFESQHTSKQSNGEDSSLRAELEAMIHRTAELEERLEKDISLRAELEVMTHHTAELEERLEKDSSLRAELEAMTHRTAELEAKLQKVEAEKAELQTALMKAQESVEASEFQLMETGKKLEELQKELSMTNETKESLECQLISMEAEARTLSTKIDALVFEVEKEKVLSGEITVKCQKLEEELSRKKEEAELQQNAKTKAEPKIKQEDLSMAAGKLADCQRTIASLGKQLQSLATLEDFLIDTASIPEFSGGGTLISKAGGEPWKLHSNATFAPKKDSDTPAVTCESTTPVNKIDRNSPQSSTSSSSTGFAKFFTRSKNGIQLEI